MVDFNKLQSILIIDDDQHFCEFLTLHLSLFLPESVAIEQWNPQQHPIDDIEWGNYQLVFLDNDFGMAGQNGMQLLSSLDPDLCPPILFVTSNASIKTAKDALRYGAINFLVKWAINESVLSEQVEHAISYRPQLARQSLEIGSEFLGYTVRQWLGQGEGSNIYFVEDKQSNSFVLKLFDYHPSLVGSKRRAILKKATDVSRIHHPSVSPVSDSGVNAGEIYIVSPYLPNGSLRERLLGSLEKPKVGKWLKSILSAVAEIHAYDLVIGNLCSSNIYFDAEDKPVLLPPVSQLEGVKSHSLVYIWQQPKYIAPEVRNNIFAINQTADLYSLGILMYEMMVEPLPDGASPDANKISRLPSRLQMNLNSFLKENPEDRLINAKTALSLIYDT